MAGAALVAVRRRGRRRAPIGGDHLAAWPRGILLANSDVQCRQCHGMGGEPGRPCGCVLRRICRAVVERVWNIREREDRPIQVRYWGGRAKGRRMPWVVYSRQYEEFLADVELVARRSLSERQWTIFRHHHLGGEQWRRCSRRVGLERGRFFHEVYRLEERLGRVFRELRPYALFPTREYFGLWRAA